jgi:hypothetical protein
MFRPPRPYRACEVAPSWANDQVGDLLGLDGQAAVAEREGDRSEHLGALPPHTGDELDAVRGGGDRATGKRLARRVEGQFAGFGQVAADDDPFRV